MAILVTAPEMTQPVVKGRIALIDADVVAYYCSFGLDEFQPYAAETKLQQRCSQIEVDTQAEHFRYYLSGKNNFREDVAKFKRYKGNRYDVNGNRILPQPKHLAHARAWLQAHKQADVAHGQEADDTISIAAAKIRASNGKWHSVISTVDKDLGINPGLFHNQMDNSITDGTEFGEIHLAGTKMDTLKGRGLKFFYAQLLMGDATDWIPGLPKASEWQVQQYGIRRGGCGPMAAFKTLDTADTADECFFRVAFCYQEYWTGKETADWRTPDKLVKADWLTQLIEQGRLLWLRQEEGQMWEPTAQQMEYYAKRTKELLQATTRIRT